MSGNQHPGPQALPEELPPSKLGTREYWDNIYDTEIANHVSNSDDIGTVWFDDSNAEHEMVAFLNRHASSRPRPKSSADAATATASTAAEAEVEALETLLRRQLDKATTSFLDLGTGNGSLLHALRRAGWAGRCLGVDYSAAAVALARQVAAATTSYSSDAESSSDEDEDEKEDEDGAEQREQEQEQEDTDTDKKRSVRVRVAPDTHPVDFAQWDVLAGPLEDSSSVSAGTWDVVLDKGTFDAACLSGEVDAAGRRPGERYRARVLRLLRPGDGGVFLVTSCNWTGPELRAWFEGAASAAGGAADSSGAAGGSGGAEGKGEGKGEGRAVGAAARFEYAGQVEYRAFTFGGVKGQTISTLCFVKRELREP